jgi:pimeloyl-ACP methyl ester carboxylesterase
MSDQIDETHMNERDYLTLNDNFAGETVVRGHLYDTRKFGYETKIDAIGTEQVIVPVYLDNAEVVVRLTQKPVFYTREGGTLQKEDKEREGKVGVTWIHLGGAASQDDSYIGDLMVRLHEATKDSDITLNNVIIAAHPLGAPKSAGKFDENDFSDSAEALLQALRDPNVKISGKVIISGLSAGGGVAAKLASIMPDVDAVVLMDPAGMGEHKQMGLRFGVIDPYLEYQHLKEGTKGAFNEAWSRLANSMSTGKGAPTNILDLVGAFFPDETHKKIIDAYGLRGDQGKSGLRMDLLSRDSTEEARRDLGENKKINVIVSPAMAGNVVNFLREKNNWSTEDVNEATRNPESATAKRLVAEANITLSEMFPTVNPSNIHLLPWWRNTHMSIGSEQKYMDNVVKGVNGVISVKK